MMPIVVTELDKRQRERVRLSQRDRGPAVDCDKARSQPASHNGDRWATFNAFMDTCCPLLSHVESKIWLLLFRDTKPDGLARTSSRDLAQRAGCSLRAVSLAMHLLKCAKLLEVVTASTNRGCPSVFRVTKKPQLCRDKLRDEKAKSPPETVATISTVDGDSTLETVAAISTVDGGNRGKN
jgi:hypothetical protein